MTDVNHSINYLKSRAKRKGCDLDLLIKVKQERVFDGQAWVNVGARFRNHCEIFLTLDKNEYAGTAHARSLSQSCLDYCFDQALSNRHIRTTKHHNRKFTLAVNESCDFSVSVSETPDKTSEILDLLFSYCKLSIFSSFNTYFTASQGLTVYASTDEALYTDKYFYQSLFFHIGLSNGLHIRYGFLDPDIAVNDIEPRIKTLCQSLSRLSTGKSLPSGKYDMILNADQMAFLFSCYDRIWSAKWAKQGVNPFKNCLGKKVFDERLTVVDRPTLSNRIMKIRFDDEGNRTSDHVLVQNGRLESLLHNTDTAQHFSVDNTSNAFWSYMLPLDIRPHRLCIEASIKDQTCIYSGSYIVVLGFIGLEPSIDTLTGDFKCRVYGFFMKENTYQYAFHNAHVAGNFYHMLNQIEAISDTASWDCCQQGLFPAIRFGNIRVV